MKKTAKNEQQLKISFNQDYDNNFFPSQITDVSVKNKRPGREIKIDNNLLDNNNIIAKIGTVDDKHEPTTVYIYISFWIEVKKSVIKNNEDNEHFDNAITKKFSNHLNNIYKIDLKEDLSNNKYFPDYYNNIYMFDFPENINYNNNKKCFAYIELNLHTINSKLKNKKYPLRTRDETVLYDEALRILKKMSQSLLLKGKYEFKVTKHKK